MNIMKIEKFSTSNGPGLRHVLWTSGCDFKCPGCHNPETWSRDAGRPFDWSDYDVLTSDFKTMSNVLSGITVLGGEPLLDVSIETVTQICKRFKEEYPDKTIWMWTGNIFEKVKNLEVMKYVDVLIDGPFILTKMDLRLTYCGSTNQRVIDVKQSCFFNEVVLVGQRMSKEYCVMDEFGNNVDCFEWTNEGYENAEIFAIENDCVSILEVVYIDEVEIGFSCVWTKETE